MKYTLIVYSLIEKTWFYERLFFEVVIVMAEDNVNANQN